MIFLFCGIVALNRQVDAVTAKKMHSIFEIIIAPSFTLKHLKFCHKKNLRLLTLPFTNTISQNLK